MNYFDVDPYLPRRARRAVAIGLALGFVVVPGPTSRLIDAQIHERAAEITATLDGLVRTDVANAFRAESHVQLMKTRPLFQASGSNTATRRNK